MTNRRRIYLLRARELSPETIAVAFAKTSRSPEPFDQTAAELTEAGSARFHEKWVVGYGHSSVAEHAVLHIAAENVSRLAIECIESSRLASFTEKSTRYQQWSGGAFVVPPEIAGGEQKALFRAACERLLGAYRRALEGVGALARREWPRAEGESDARWEGRLRSPVSDVCRYLLPAAVLANVGITINARALEHALRKMLSHPLGEVRAIGAEIKAAALAEVPTLVKYAEENAYLRNAAETFRSASAEPGNPPETAEIPARNRIRLARSDPEAEELALAAAGVRFCNWGLAEARERLRNAPDEGKKRLAEALLGALGEHDVPLRELEYVNYTFEAVMDQGAYFEVKRHRMTTQTPAPLTGTLGYLTPRRIAAAGLQAEYRAAMDQAAEAYETLREAVGSDAAAYVVPNGFLRRMVLGMNLREAFHFCRLRSAESAHAAARIIALQAAEQIRAASPLLGAYLRTEGNAGWEDLEREFFL
jgi:thymidylate synthase ThyX